MLWMFFSQLTEKLPYGYMANYSSSQGLFIYLLLYWLFLAAMLAAAHYGIFVSRCLQICKSDVSDWLNIQACSWKSSAFYTLFPQYFQKYFTNGFQVVNLGLVNFWWHLGSMSVNRQWRRGGWTWGDICYCFKKPPYLYFDIVWCKTVAKWKVFTIRCIISTAFYFIKHSDNY